MCCLRLAALLFFFFFFVALVSLQVRRAKFMKGECVVKSLPPSVEMSFGEIDTLRRLKYATLRTEHTHTHTYRHAAPPQVRYTRHEYSHHTC